MSVFNETIQPLRVYSSLNYLAFNRRMINDVIDHVPVISSSTLLPPFTVVIPYLANAFTYTLYNKKTLVSTNITSLILADTNYKYGTSKTYLRYFGNTAFLALGRGIYRLIINDGTNNWYTEYFEIKSTTGTVEFEYWNTIDIKDILYQGDFKFRFRIPMYLSDTGEYYEYSEQIEDTNKNVYPQFQQINKKWEINTFGNSYLYDVYKFIKLHDNVYLTDTTGEKGQIEITEVIGEKIPRTDYLNIIIKFKFTNNLVQVSNLDDNIRIKTRIITTEAGEPITTENGEPITAT
jgi:hypothetical protein